MIASTKNFNVKIDQKIICTCGHPDCDKRSINQETLDRLQLVRDEYGKPMVITSGGRCPYHPYQAKKSDPNSGDHPKGRGVDIQVTSRVEFNRLAVIAGRQGFNAIGDGLDRGFMHIGVRDGEHIASWGY